MSDINIKELQLLRLRMQILENLTLAAAIGIGAAVYFRKDDWTYWLVGALFFLFIYKYYTRVRLRKREFLSNIVEQRTMELRFQRDKIQAESQKLEQALAALAEAQDELVRKERLASVGQLTKGLVDRILNPLNYINNFAGLSVTLVEEIGANLNEDERSANPENREDSKELLGLLSTNLDKISKHGASTVRIVKAMEELLKDRSGNRVSAAIDEVAKVSLEIWKKNCRKEIETRGIAVRFQGLSAPLTIEVNVEQLEKALVNVLNNSIYAVLKKAPDETFRPEISLSLRIVADQVEISVRDNGIGIEEGIKDKIFSPFFTTKPTGEAAGVGLYLTREVVLNHKGSIRIDSEKNRYTEVMIALPIYS